MPTSHQIIEHQKEVIGNLEREGSAQGRQIEHMTKVIAELNAQRFVTVDQEIRMGIVKGGAFSFNELRMIEAAEVYVRDGFAAMMVLLEAWSDAAKKEKNDG